MHPIRSKDLLSVKFCKKYIIFGIFFQIGSSLSADVIVQTKSGPVKGFEVRSGHSSMHIFKNVPYAKQPIGDLRFQLPQDVEEWYSEDELNYSGEIYCPQEKNFGQEDCLVLDIYLRKIKALGNEKEIDKEESKALPILIYFHPGKFSHGSKEEYSSDYLLEYNDVIVVIPNYRLGILGFLSLPDSSLPGNLGLFDQRMAMKWVHKNIEAFGGDRERVTIAGHGSGGASVGFHILSPRSHSYFSAAISGSGTALDPWTMTYDPARNVEILTEKLKCSNFSDTQITCLKTCDLNSILKAQKEFQNSHVHFLPTVDEKAETPFLPFPPRILYEKGYQKDVKYMAGVTQAEELNEVDNSFTTAIKSQHLDSIVQYLIGPYLGDLRNFPLIVKAAKYHYLRGVNIPTFESIKPQMVNMMFDILYNSPLHLTLKWHSRKTPDTFMYVFNFEDGENSFNESYTNQNKKRYSGLGQMKDIFYIMRLPKRLPSNNLIANNVKENLCRIWGNFIESKSPSPDPVWKPFNENEMNYAEISETVKPKVNYRKNDIEFWTLLVPDLVNIQNQNETVSIKPLKEIRAGGWGAAGLIILLSVFCIALVGVVIVTRRKYTQSSIVPLNSRKEERKYSSIG